LEFPKKMILQTTYNRNEYLLIYLAVFCISNHFRDQFSHCNLLFCPPIRSRWFAENHVIGDAVLAAPAMPKSGFMANMRAPAQGGHHSGVMADTIPAPWRTLFRRDDGHFGGSSGMLSAMTPERLGS
jgi:hypothetical protein